MALKCPKCGTTKSKDITKRTAKSSSKATSAGIGAAIGTVVLGPIGLLAGAALGSMGGHKGLVWTDSRDRQVKIFQCTTCKEIFYKCNNCGQAVNLSNHNCPYCYATIKMIEVK